MKKILFLAVIPLALSISSCEKKTGADVIVFADSIYTSNENNQFVEAFAIKNGKYVAVGSKKDVERFLGKNTVVYNAKFAMSGGIESHGHWILNEAFKLGFYIDPMNYKDGEPKPKTFNQILDEIKEYRIQHPEENGIYGYGIDVTKNYFPDLKAFDEAFPDIPVFISESSLHGAYVNSKCFEMAGVLNEDKDGIKIDRDEKGHVIGIARDEACTYIRNKIFGAVVSPENYKIAVRNAARELNSYGYVIHYDTWSNFDGTDEMYKAIHAVDEEGNLDFLFSSAYCIESFQKDKIDEMILKTLELKNTYTSNHFKPTMLKLFADGIVESGTGFRIDPYNTDPKDYGTQIWDASTMTSIVDKANELGISVHIHTMGDAACKEAVDAFVYSYGNNGYIRNSLAHVAMIREDELKRIKQYDIGVTSGANWASQITQDDIDTSSVFISEDVLRNLYPYKEYVDYGIKAALHTDNPCSPGNLDLFGYIQVMLNGWDHSKPINKDTFIRRNTGFVTLKDAIDMFTINGAWMNNLENERGSIEVGKYADFIFTNKNPFEQKVDDVWQVGITNTFFEGKEVYHNSAI